MSVVRHPADVEDDPAVDVFGADGTPIRGAEGELVCTRPFPSMPVAFWDDPNGSLSWARRTYVSMSSIRI